MEKVWILFSAAVLILGFQNCSNSTNFAATGELIAKAESDDSSDGSIIDISQPVSDNNDSGNDDVVTTPPTMPPSDNDDVMTPPTAPPTTPPVVVVPPPTTVIPPVVVVPPTMPPSDNDDVMTPPTAPPTTPPVVVAPPPTTEIPPVVVVPPTMPPSDDDDTMTPPTVPPVVVTPPSDEDDSGALAYVCVLRSHGKSVKIALSNDGSLGGKKGTPSDVCMSENACLNILSKSFEVVSAEKRGFCPNKNPHVIAMTDMQIQAALARAALMKSLAGN